MGKSDKWFVIRNPAAGSGQGKILWPKIEQFLQEAGIKGEFVETNHPQHAISLVNEGVKKGYRKFIAVGGDGTNNEVINGIFQQELVAPSELIYTLIPVGTGNDWIKTHGIPNDFKKWIPQITTGKIIEQDIGILSYYKNGKQERRYFTNVAGLAFDAHICEVAEKSNKNQSNQLFYLGLIFRELFNYRLRKARVTFDDKIVEDYFYTINIGICRYSGGGMQFVPHAIPNDGLLALTLAGKFSPLGVLINSWRFYSGRIAGHSKVQMFKTKKIQIESLEKEPTLVEVDGEFLGEAPVEISIIEKALRVIIPKRIK